MTPFLSIAHHTMIAKSLLFVSGCAAVANAYVAPMMMSASRRDVLAGAAAASVAAPLLRAAPAEAKVANLAAPYVYIFDGRGCDRVNNVGGKEYNGKYNGDEEDLMCVKVELKPVKVSESAGAAFKQEALSFKNMAANSYNQFDSLPGGLVNRN